MDENIEKKMQELLDAAENRKQPADFVLPKEWTAPNSLSDRIKTREDGELFMRLLNSVKS